MLHEVNTYSLNKCQYAPSAVRIQLVSGQKGFDSLFWTQRRCR